MSFIVSEEGAIIEPMIEGSSHPDFDQPTLRAIERWRYKPAMLDGKPVEESAIKTVIRYTIADADSAGAKFVQSYRAIYESITAKNLTEASSMLEQLGEGPLNYYEQAWLSWLNYVYLEATGTAEADQLMKSLLGAIGSDDDDRYLEPDVLVSALQRLYALRARAGDFSGAVTVFERLKASQAARRSQRYEDVVASMEPVNQQIMGLVAGPTVLQQIARVGKNDYWVYRLLRRSFAWGAVEGGKLDVVDLRCTRANRRFPPIPEGTVLKIPDTWGDCSVYIKGDVGTTFVFEEYPGEQANESPPREAALDTP